MKTIIIQLKYEVSEYEPGDAPTEDEVVAALYEGNICPTGFKVNILDAIVEVREGEE